MDSIEVMSKEMRQAVSDAAAAVLPEHDPMCRQGESWICDCAVIGRVREVERARAVAAVQAITDDPEAASWYEKFREDPDDPDKITVMVELDRVVEAIEALTE